MTWMTPFSASTSAWITVASSTVTPPLPANREQSTVDRLRLAVVSDLGRRHRAVGERSAEPGGFGGGEQSLEPPCPPRGFHDGLRICLRLLLVESL